MPRSLSLPLVSIASLLFLVACSGGSSTSSPTADATSTGGTAGSATQAFATSVPASDTIPKDQLGQINVVLAGNDYHVGRNNFVFGITNLEDEPQGGATARATFYDLKDPRNPTPVGSFDAVESAPGVGPVVVHQHVDGEHTHGGQDDNRVGYYVDFTFPHAGYWGVVVTAKLKDGTEGAQDIGFNVNERAAFPQEGDKAIASDNLTRFDVADIREIDSGDPPNDMHDVKIKDALAKGRPVVVVFSTPAYCTSRFCGPVNEEVELVMDEYKDKVDFVHIEIWRNFETKEFNPTVREWLVQPNGGLTEPWVYVIGSDGVIYDRFEGPAGHVVIEPAVKAVSEGKVFADR